MPKALVVVNAHSRSGGDATTDALTAALARHGIESVVRAPQAPGDLSPLIAAEGPGADLVVVAGGDGTLNAAAQGLLDAGKPLGLIPAGTANDLARTLEIPVDVEQAVAIIARGRTKAIDLGWVNDRPFFNVASIGLSSDLAQELTSDVKRRFGRLGYALVAIRVLARAKPFRVAIKGSAGHAKALTFQVAVGNGRYYGGGNVVEQDARIDSGRLALYSLEFSRAWRLALMLRSFRAGEHGAWNEVRTLSGEAFEIRTRRPRPVNADGEIVTQTPAVFRIAPGAVQVFTPDAAEPA